MATARLVPSSYTLSNSNYFSVSSASNCYTNTDNSTNRATFQTTSSSTSSRYVYLNGFNLSDIPSNAQVSSFTVKVKAYGSGLSTSAAYPCLTNGTSQLSNTNASTRLSTSAQTITIPTGSLTWANINSYGSSFGIRIDARRNNRNTASYVYVYGAEIEVTYTVPVYYDVTITNSTSATVTASETNPLEGTDVEIRSDTMSGITVRDNGVDVTNQFTQRTDSGASYDVVTVGTYGFALSNGYYVSQNKGVDKSAAVSRVDFHLPVSANITFSYINYAEATYDFGVFGNVDVALSNSYYAAGSNGATITDSSYKKACSTSSDNTSSVQTLTYSNVSAGNHSIWVKFSKDDASAANNDTLQFQVSITLNEPFTPGTYWGYTIADVQADHAIVVSSSGPQPTLYVKLSGSWVQVQRAYKKANGSWSEVDVDEAFESGVNYVKGQL